ncbi:DNA/RNA polymerase superfamily protein [Dorcoceras hygrometricum]|uniref:DNA/RNA polymerase superfamily protein n=1 Tax=Dorcoceras hygrometricum TaxID=472368 RepID=A0A2Z7C1M1_9LAMI|nr:DNA/RNA polymerase superfamily protein [Dorcoceras hygrometricum]
MRQRRWLELVKDYDCTISYHPGKANVVADALSRKSARLAQVTVQQPLAKEIERFGLELVSSSSSNIILADLSVRSNLLNRIREGQQQDQQLKKWVQQNKERGNSLYFSEDGIVRYLGRIWVPQVNDLRAKLLKEAHTAPYSVHPGSTKMYKDLQQLYWWPGMKRDVAKFVAECLTCQLVKAEHQRPAGLLKPLPIPEWKWESITMDFVTGLPRTVQGYNSIWVIIDRLTKSAHFLPVKMTYEVSRYAELYVKEIVRLHGVPISIVSDRDPKFTSAFWKSLHKAMGTKLTFSTAFHPQTDGQSERVIQILEDLLRACIVDFSAGWDVSLPLVEFAYNNSFQASIQMAPYEALYGRKCRTPLHWDEVGERAGLGPDVVEQTAAAVRKIRERMKTAQSRQKSYADNRRRELNFEIGDRVFFRIAPMKGVMRFGKKGKLSPRYIGPYEILEKVGTLAYRLALPPQMSAVHNVFHVSALRKYVPHPRYNGPTSRSEKQLGKQKLIC